MTKVTIPISFRKTARFAGNWLASVAESRSARRRLNAILRLACRMLGMKRRGGLGMLGIGGAVALLAVGLASPALAQYMGTSPAIGQAGVPAGVFRLSNGFGYEENAINVSSLAFTVPKGAVITSPGVVKADGVVVPLNVPLDKDYFFPQYKGEFPKGTFFKGPVIMSASDTAFSLRFPVGTVFPTGTTSAPGKLPDWVVPGVPTTAEIIVPPNNGNIKFPAAASLPAIPDTRLGQIAINTNPSDAPAMTGNLAKDIAIGTGANADGKYVSRPIPPATVDPDAKDPAFIPLGALAVGDAASSTGPAAVALGYFAKSSGGWTTAIGGSSSATGNYATAIGVLSSASGRQSTAIGFGAEATQENAIAFGLNAKARGNRALAIGSGAEANKDFASAFGRTAIANGENSLALGTSSTATEKDSVALGSNAKTEAVHFVADKVTLNGKDYAIVAGANSVVSLGNNDADPAKRVKRQIANVAAGEVSATSTDVVTGGQLNAAYEGIKTLGDDAARFNQSVADALGEGTTLDANGKLVTPSLTVLGTLPSAKGQKVTAFGAIMAVGEGVEYVNKNLIATNDTVKTQGETLAGQGVDLDTAETNIGNLQKDALLYNKNLGAFSAAHGTDKTSRISNLADGIDANDAVNFGQFETASSKLDEAVKTVAQNIAALSSGASGLVTADADGKVLAIGSGSGATTVDLGHQVAKLDDTGKAVVDADGKPVMETKDRVLTGIADGVARNDAVNKGQLDVVDGKVTDVKKVADAAKTGADAATTKLANLSDGTVQASINTATAKIGQASTVLGQSVADALGAKLGTDGKVAMPSLDLTSLGKDASGNPVVQPVTVLGGLKAVDGVVAAQGDRLTTAEGTLKTQGAALAGQGTRLGAAETSIGSLQQDALLYNKTLSAYSAAHGADKTSRISNVAAGIAGTDAVNKEQLDNILGTDRDISGKNSFAIGNKAKSQGAGAFAIGNSSDAAGNGSIIIGGTANVIDANGKATVRSASTVAGATDSVVIGAGGTVLGNNSVAIGSKASAISPMAVAIGSSSVTGGLAATAIGNNANASGNYSAAIGLGAKAANAHALALGSGANATGDQAISIGRDVSALGKNSFALGHNSIAEGEGSFAMGSTRLRADGINWVSPAIAKGNFSMVFGSGAYTHKDFAIALGHEAKANGENSLAFGRSATATEKDSVALGSNATTEAAHSVGDKVTLNGKNYGIAAGANSVVSLGNNDADPAKRVKRQIINVAAGDVSATSTDAVTGSQLNAAYEGIKALGDGAIQYSMTKDTTGKDIIDYSKVQLRGISGTKIENVAAGQLSSTSTDAVNGSQLNTTNEKINALDVAAGTRLVAAENNLAAVKTTAEAAKTGADAATTKLAGLSDDTVQKSIDASATKLGEAIGQSAKTIDGNLAAVKTIADAAKTGADIATTKLADLSDDTVQKSIDASATKLGETIGQSVKAVEGNLAAVKTTAEAAKTGADAATTKLAGLSNDTVQASINTATAKIGQASTVLGQSVADALGAKLGTDGKVAMPSLDLTSLGKDASGNAVAQPSTMLGGLKALDGVVASQDIRDIPDGALSGRLSMFAARDATTNATRNASFRIYPTPWRVPVEWATSSEIRSLVPIARLVRFTRRVRSANVKYLS